MLLSSADATVEWRDLAYVKDSPVTAALDGDELRIVAQPISGRLQPRYGRFEALPPIGEDALLQLGPNSLPKLMADALAASLLPIKFETFSAWSRLVPVLFALFSIVRPRRYVELGVHNGMSFFGACQVSEHAQTNTECVAIDFLGWRSSCLFPLVDSIRRIQTKSHEELSGRIFHPGYVLTCC